MFIKHGDGKIIKVIKNGEEEDKKEECKDADKKEKKSKE